MTYIAKQPATKIETVTKVAILCAFGLVGTQAADVPFSFSCDRSGGFVPNPGQQQRVGYITDFSVTQGSGVRAALLTDLKVFVPFYPTYPKLGVSPPARNTLSTAIVAGVIENFAWPGRASDPITFQFYVSQQNAAQLKAVQQQTLLGVHSIGWLIEDYSQEQKLWFDQAKPSSSQTINAMIQSLTVDLTPVPAADGINVFVYKVSMAIVPQAHQVSTFLFTPSPGTTLSKTWGLP